VPSVYDRIAQEVGQRKAAAIRAVE